MAHIFFPRLFFFVLAWFGLSFLLHCFARYRSWETWKCCYLCHCFVYLFFVGSKEIYLHSYIQHTCILYLSSVSISWYHTMNKKMVSGFGGCWCCCCGGNGGGGGVVQRHITWSLSSMAYSIHFFAFSSSQLNSKWNTRRWRWKLPKMNTYIHTQRSFVNPLHHHHHRYIYIFMAYIVIW